MQACNFAGAHPVGKPRDWIPELDGECGTIFCLDHRDDRIGYNFKYSIYLPTPADIAAINAGAALRLGIMCEAHPVFNMVWLTKPICDDINLTPMWDLGEPMK